MTDILRSNEMLFTNQMVVSANGEYVLVLQADSNLVLYEKVHHEDGNVFFSFPGNGPLAHRLFRTQPPGAVNFLVTTCSLLCNLGKEDYRHNG